MPHNRWKFISGVSKVTYYLYYSKCLYLYLQLCVTSILIKSSFISPN